METIFVSIASYRDILCSDTILHLFNMAKYPNRVYLGICEQNRSDKPQEKCRVRGSHESRVRRISLSYKDAKGPTWARYLCSTLYKNEDYFLQIDSHCLFVKDWDEKCIQMIHALENSPLVENKKVLLSHYPPMIDDYKENPTNEKVTHMVECFFNEEGLLSFKGAKWKKPGKLPRRNAFIAGGFIFVRGRWLTEVPFDPYLDFLFIGEEILLSSRSFTNGWDVYTPNQNIVFHAYTRKDEPKFWNDVTYNDSKAKQRVKIITGLDHDIQKLKDPKSRKSLEKYGTGKVRSLKDFYDFIGVDVEKKIIGKPKIEFYCPNDDRVDTANALFYANIGVACAILALWIVDAFVHRSSKYSSKVKGSSTIK